MSFLLPTKRTRLSESRVAVVREAQPRDDDSGWSPIGAQLRDLPSMVQKRSQEAAVNTYIRNPLANRTLKIYASFLAGEGFSVGSNHPEVDAVLQEFWTSPRSDLERNHRGFARDWLMFGEAIHPVRADEAGNATFGFIDPSMVDTIVRSEQNNMILKQLILRSKYGGQPDPPLDVVTLQTDPTAGADAGRMTGDVFVWLYERIGAATRGLPMLLPILDWFELYDESMWEIHERRKAMRAHMWDVSVDGSPDDVEALEAKWGTAAPRTGSTRFHTSNVEISSVSPALGQHEDNASLRAMLRQLSAGGGLAPHWLGDPEDANRSTAESMDVPVLRSLVDTQAVWRLNVRDVLRYVVDRKVAAGMLPAVDQRHNEQGDPLGGSQNRVPTRDMVEVIVPEIESKKVAESAQTLLSVAQAMIALDSVGGVHVDAVRKIVRTLLPSLGVPADEIPEEDPDEQQTSDDIFDGFAAEVARRGF